jgi:(p)ppGpp synthase/HD superfamily hydrolase
MAALAHAERRHAGQRRQADGAPFILHPLEVCCLLYDTGAPDHVIAAGVVDDTIEKTDANAAGLRTRFGLTIATLEALMVFAADRISKAQELSLDREQTRQSRLPLVTQLRTASTTLPVSVNRSAHFLAPYLSRPRRDPPGPRHRGHRLLVDDDGEQGGDK